MLFFFLRVISVGVAVGTQGYCIFFRIVVPSGDVVKFETSVGTETIKARILV